MSRDEVSKSCDKEIVEVEIKGVFYTCLDATQTKPNFRKLFELLEKTSYKGPEQEYKINPNELVTLEDLTEIVQASTQQLLNKLRTINHIVTIQQKLRLLDFNYHFRILNLMLKVVQENSWNPDEIRFTDTVEALQDLAPEEIITELFDLYTEDTKMIDGEQLYAYKEIAVSRTFARALLRTGGRYDLEDFMDAWRNGVPEGMEATEEALQGIAVVDREAKVVFSLEEEDLPEDVEERLEVLFEKKGAWSREEIRPYVQ